MGACVRLTIDSADFTADDTLSVTVSQSNCDCVDTEPQSSMYRTHMPCTASIV